MGTTLSQDAKGAWIHKNWFDNHVSRENFEGVQHVQSMMKHELRMAAEQSTIKDNTVNNITRQVWFYDNTVHASDVSGDGMMRNILRLGLMVDAVAVALADEPSVRGLGWPVHPIRKYKICSPLRVLRSIKKSAVWQQDFAEAFQKLPTTRSSHAGEKVMWQDIMALASSTLELTYWAPNWTNVQKNCDYRAEHLSTDWFCSSPWCRSLPGN